MKILTIDKANELKAKGYTDLAAVVANIFGTEYFNINTIDEVLANNGKWIPAKRGFNGERRGVLGSTVNWIETVRTARI